MKLVASLSLVSPVLLASLLLAGCPSDTTDPLRGDNGGSAGVTPIQGGQAGATGNGFAGIGPDDEGSAGTSGGGGGGRASTGTTAMPCDVVSILKLRCQSCHGSTPLAGVPMALMSWEDLEAPSVSDPSRKVRELVAERIVDSTLPMPPKPSMMLAGAELTTMQTWLSGGGIAGTDPTCAPKDDGPLYEGEIPPFADNCYEVRAHAAGTKDAPLMVTGENYATFYFDAPWPDGAQGVYFETIKGEHPEIIHHWLVYAEESSNTPDGEVNYPAFGTHPSAPTLVAGWAPGADNNDLPDDVGLQLSAANRKMSLEIHFFGAAGQTFPVTAGVKICTVEKPERLRPNTATISWLGTELGINIPPNAQDSVATGVCTPAFTQDIHILRSWPHMHLLGRKMTSTILRKDGTREDMSPAGGWAFDFNSEVSHPSEFVLHPGDRVETNCHYTNDKPYAVQVGFENRYEMCFNFVTAYPAKALVNKGIATSTSLTNSATACLY